MDTNKRDARKRQSLRRHSPKPDVNVVEIGMFTGPRRASRADQGFSSSVHYRSSLNSVSVGSGWCVR